MLLFKFTIYQVSYDDPSECGLILKTVALLREPWNTLTVKQGLRKEISSQIGHPERSSRLKKLNRYGGCEIPVLNSITFEVNPEVNIGIVGSNLSCAVSLFVVFLTLLVNKPNYFRLIWIIFITYLFWNSQRERFSKKYYWLRRKQQISIINRFVDVRRKAIF